MAVKAVRLRDAILFGLLLVVVIELVVLLTLRLAPDAYIAIGFAFALPLVATLGVIVSAHSISVRRSEPNLPLWLGPDAPDDRLKEGIFVVW